MPTIPEAASGAKALFLLAASLSGLEVSPQSPERFVDMVKDRFARVEAENRRPEAVAGLLKVIAETLLYAQEHQILLLSERTVDEGKGRICPLYPCD
jgi:hypothetical protein